MISGITGISGMGNYRISSIHGNPYTLNPVSRIDDDTTQSGKALVIAASQQKDDLYVKDYGNLESTGSTATGDFAEMLGIQEDMLTAQAEQTQSQSMAASYYNDMIGLMGYQNQIREQLGTSFIPFE